MKRKYFNDIIEIDLKSEKTIVFPPIEETISYREFMERNYGKEISLNIVKCIVFTYEVDECIEPCEFGFMYTMDHAVIVYEIDDVEFSVKVLVSDYDRNFHGEWVFHHLYNVLNESSMDYEMLNLGDDMEVIV